MKGSFIYLFLMITVSAAYGQKAVNCSVATANDETFWGHIASEIEDGRPIAKLVGIVRAPDNSPINSALVEIFIDDGRRTPTTPKTKRLIGCVTQENGKYQFKGLKNGRYILAIGAHGFNITFVRFKFDQNNRKARKNLDIYLELGT